MSLFVAPYLIIEEDDQEWVYGRMMDPNGLPNYYPPQDKYPTTMDFIMEEILFIPIESSLMVVGETDHIAYRYLFTTVKHQTVSLGPDPLKIGISNVEITIEVQRFVFQMVEGRKAKITTVGDSIYPPRLIQLEFPTKEVALSVQAILRKMVGEYNAWYLNRQI